MICYIVGAGDFYGEITPDSGDTVIAADGGYDTLLGLKITPDVIIGDMDSTALGEMPSDIQVIKHPVEKDETDAYLAYRIGVQKGYRDFRLYGGVGGRPDHTFANYSLLYGAKLEGNRVVLVDKNYEVFVIKDEKLSMTGRTGSTFSVFAIGGKCESVTINGAKYNASGVSLDESFALGVSNSFIGGNVTVEAKGGALLIMKETS